MAEKKKEGEASPNDGGSKKMFLFGALAAVLVVAVGFGGYMIGASGSSPEEESPQAQEQPKKKEPSNESNGVIGPMVNIEPFIVNILEENGTRYLKAAITMEVDGEEVVGEVEERMAQVKDALLLKVGNKTFEELRDLQGKLQLRAELIESLNEILTRGKVRKIYFTDFVVQ